jgi:hypothetical protein
VISGEAIVHHRFAGATFAVVVFAILTITVATNTLRRRNRFGDLLSTMAGAAAAAATFHASTLLFVTAIVTVIVLFVFGLRSGAPGEYRRDGEAAPVSPSAPARSTGNFDLVATELRWIRRGAPSLAASFVVALLILLAAPLAARNNGVVSPLALTRIWTLCGAVATGVVASPLLRARAATLRYRVLEELLPQSDGRRLLMSVIPALIAVTPLALLAFITAPLSVALFVTVEIYALATAFALHGETSARSATRDTLFLLAVVAVALAMGLHPVIGFSAAGLFLTAALRSSRRALRLDFPRFTSEELE